MADWLSFAGDVIGAGAGYAGSTAGSEGSGSYTKKKNIDPAGINKLIYDVLSSDQGLAALAGGENAAGGTKSTTKGILAQDLIAKVVGELANVTATETKSDTSSVKKGTVICTELVRQGLLSEELYVGGFDHFSSLSNQTIRGYQVWAKKIVPLMREHRWLAELLAPIGVGRYEFIVNKKITFWGLITVYLGQPICHIIGLFVSPFSAFEVLPE
jgi:hypothetical protein